MSLREELSELSAQVDYMRAEDIRSWVRDHGQALLDALEENAKLWDLVCWNIDNFRDLPLTDGYYDKWLGRAETLLAARCIATDQSIDAAIKGDG